MGLHGQSVASSPVRGKAPPLLLQLCALALLACAGTTAADSLPLVNTSHRGTVHDLAYDAQRRLLFSAGEDGTVRVWSHDRRTIVRHLRLGAVRVMRIELHPERPLLAAFARSTMGEEVLEVWDWQSERQLFRHRLAEAPLHLGFTSLGSSLVYSLAQFDSVVFLDPATGERQTRLPSAIGIVSFIATSTNERTIMTYQPTGEVRYWDAATRELKAVVPTLPGLESLVLSADKNLLVARSGGEMVTIDVVTGAVRSRLQVARQAQVAVADRDAEFSVLRPDDQEDGGYVLQQFSLDRALTPRAEYRLHLGTTPTAAAYAHRTLFFADGGTIWEAGSRWRRPVRARRTGGTGSGCRRQRHAVGGDPEPHRLCPAAAFGGDTGAGICATHRRHRAAAACHRQRVAQSVRNRGGPGRDTGDNRAAGVSADAAG